MMVSGGFDSCSQYRHSLTWAVSALLVQRHLRQAHHDLSRLHLPSSLPLLHRPPSWMASRTEVQLRTGHRQITILASPFSQIPSRRPLPPPQHQLQVDPHPYVTPNCTLPIPNAMHHSLLCLLPSTRSFTSRRRLYQYRPLPPISTIPKRTPRTSLLYLRHQLSPSLPYPNHPAINPPLPNHLPLSPASRVRVSHPLRGHPRRPAHPPVFWMMAISYRSVLDMDPEGSARGREAS